MAAGAEEAAAAGALCLKGHRAPNLQVPNGKNLQGASMEPGGLFGALEFRDEARLPFLSCLPGLGLARCSHMHPCVEHFPVRQNEKHTPAGASSPLPLPRLFARGVALRFWALPPSPLALFLFPRPPLLRRRSRRGVPATGVVRLQGFAVAVLSVEFDPTTEHLVKGRVGLIVRIRQRPLIL